MVNEGFERIGEEVVKTRVPRFGSFKGINWRQQISWERWFTFETLAALAVGVALIALRESLDQSTSVLADTLILVLFLSGIMGVWTIPFPNTFRGKPIKLFWYPVICGILSAFMDSFLVLLLINKAELTGSYKDQLKFKVYATLAALIGGLYTYFGEVYALPLALRNGMHYWHSMAPLWFPITLYLILLGYLAKSLNIQVGKVPNLEEQMKDEEIDFDSTLAAKERKTTNYAVFGLYILLLLIFHNAWLMLGLLIIGAFFLGRMEELINVIKTDLEVTVVLILIFAMLIAEPIGPMVSSWHWIILGLIGIGNSIFLGAVYPPSGDVWWDMTVISTAVQVLPVSSLVGIIVFTFREWGQYFKITFPLLLFWFMICYLWFTFLFPFIK